jgi:putative addiction module killer protein
LYLSGYTGIVITVVQTEVYARWFARLRDDHARARIDKRIRRLSLGNFGDVKQLREGVAELRISYGPGYRVYFTLIEKEAVLLLAGGEKSSQENDIQTALALAKALREER